MGQFEAGRAAAGRGAAWLTWEALQPARGNSPHDATGGHASDAQPASVAGRRPTHSSVGSRQAPADTDSRGSLGTDSRPIWEDSWKGVETARVLPLPQPLSCYPSCS